MTGGLLLIPAFVLMFFPYITGDWSSSNLDFNIGENGGLALAIVWLYFMCWSSYGIEVVATFAPEYKDTQRDTRMALRTAAMFSAVVYVLLPLGLGGTLGTQAIADDATLISFYTIAFDELVGNFLGGVMIFCVVAGLVLSMNTATMDGSRALYGIAKDGMTIRQFGKLNRFRVPALAMTVDAMLNLAADLVLQQPDRDHRGVEHRLRVRDLRGAGRLPAPAQGPAAVAAPGAPRRAAGCRSAPCC